MSTRSIYWVQRRPVRKADNLTAILNSVMKTVELNFLEHYGTLRACNGIALSLPLHVLAATLKMASITGRNMCCAQCSVYRIVLLMSIAVY